jgi:Arc/MetJ-type ribon-helix-helix transcriptional regulator
LSSKVGRKATVERGSILGMKLSVSLSDADVSFVDEYARRRGAASRSSVVHQAIALLRAAELEDAYADAFDEWSTNGEAAVWETASADGVTDAAR